MRGGGKPLLGSAITVKCQQYTNVQLYTNFQLYTIIQLYTNFQVYMKMHYTFVDEFSGVYKNFMTNESWGRQNVMCIRNCMSPVRIYMYLKDFNSLCLLNAISYAS